MKVIKYAEKMVKKLSDVVIGDNVRLDNGVDSVPLAESIVMDGLQQLPEVFLNAEGKLEMGRGHRRWNALGWIQQHQPKEFKRLFADGIPIRVAENVDPEDVFSFKVDHGHQKGLTHPFELQLAMNMALRSGKKEKVIITALRPLIDQIYPLKGAAGKDVAIIEEKLSKATDDSERAKLKKELDDRVHEARRGVFQNHQRVHQSPNIVMAAMEKAARGKLTGENEKVFGNEVLPVLTYANVKSLLAYHKQDMEELGEQGQTLHSKAVPGPLFRVEWKKILGKAKDKENGDKPVTPKAISANAMRQEIKDNTFQSGLATGMLRYCSGDKGVNKEALIKADSIANVAEVVAECSPEFWTTVGEEYASIVAAQNEAAAASTEG